MDARLIATATIAAALSAATRAPRIQDQMRPVSCRLVPIDQSSPAARRWIQVQFD
jgi:hypothetical protein